MIYTGSLVKIDGNTIPHIVSFKVGRSKLWKDSERNMSGDMRATLIGIFPKIQLEIGYTTQAEMSELTALLDKDFFTVEWFDVRTQETYSAQYYAGDYDVELDSKSKGRYKPFSVSLVPLSKRRY
ncbi:MAG: hypothetical protein IKW46_07480 [Bacteroidaceae bacterium]|nr:hypothetical protein [Bacteroidaceae bacterium]